MDENVHFPEYRAPAGCMGGLAVPTLGLAGIMAGMAQFAREGAPLWLLLGMPVLLILLFLLMRIAAGRAATLTGPDGITARSAFGTRRMAWPDIQAIEIQSNPSAIADGGVIAEYVVLYDSGGRRVLLPHLNSKVVLALHEDVASLRALWERRRGADWASLPEIEQRIARARRSTNRQRGIIAGIAVWAGVTVVGLVLFLVLLLAGALGSGGGATFTLAAVAFAVTGAVVGAVVGRAVARRE